MKLQLAVTAIPTPLPGDGGQFDVTMLGGWSAFGGVYVGTASDPDILRSSVFSQLGHVASLAAPHRPNEHREAELLVAIQAPDVEMLDPALTSDSQRWRPSCRIDLEDSRGWLM